MKKLNIAKGIVSMERGNYLTRGLKPQMLREEFSVGFLASIFNSYHIYIYAYCASMMPKTDYLV